MPRLERRQQRRIDHEREWLRNDAKYEERRQSPEPSTVGLHFFIYRQDSEGA
jgi:hypothetical protein